jgi:catechol 2,3-dioxygenase-like lactoylglutathione lyase family enzyme
LSAAIVAARNEEITMSHDASTQIQATDARGEPTTLGEYNGFEVYVMPAFATLAVEDPAKTADWYESALGFKTMLAAPVVHIRRRKYQDILIVARAPGSPSGPSGVKLHFSAEGEIDALAERARSVPPLGQSFVEGPVETPWNTRELNVTDPAGNRLVFTGRSSNPSKELHERWRAHFEAGRKR